MTKENKTTIQGAPREYNERELKERQEARINMYKSFENVEKLHREFAYDLIIDIHEKLNTGYSFDRRDSLRLNPLSCFATLTLPKSVQEEAIVKLNQEVKQAYIAELQSERDRYKSLLVQQMQEAEEDKERKRQEQARAKKLAELEKAADECYGDLVIPE